LSDCTAAFEGEKENGHDFEWGIGHKFLLKGVELRTVSVAEKIEKIVTAYQ